VMDDHSHMINAMRDAGFVGIECENGIVYARSHAALPEFTASPHGDGWCFSIAWPLRASADQCADWARLHPDAPLDVALGETRMQFLTTAQDAKTALARWADLVAQMVATCTLWRRATRQMDEGM
jgi:hypothetical protein